jgi:hypothetical protein
MGDELSDAVKKALAGESGIAYLIFIEHTLCCGSECKHACVSRT